MRVKLLRDARIRHSAGETVEVSPAEAAFLTSVGSAVEIAETFLTLAVEEPKPAAKPAAKKNTGAKKKA